MGSARYIWIAKAKVFNSRLEGDGLKIREASNSVSASRTRAVAALIPELVQGPIKKTS
jgi:hypothetical protein